MEGFTGCISSVIKDGKDIFLYDQYNEFKWVVLFILFHLA